MNHRETIRLFAILTAAYPKFDVFRDEKQLAPIIELWTEMLSDIPYPIAETAIKKLILESHYPPTISDVRKQVVDITTHPADRIDGTTAWGEVVNAIRMYGYYRPEEALASMSPRVRNVVKMIGWEEICTCKDPGVIRGQFIKMYNAFSEREKQKALLPPTLNNMIHQIGTRENLQLVEGGKK